ncbi:glycoside hydrolase family 127 protein [Paenibacillus sp. TAF58]
MSNQLSNKHRETIKVGIRDDFWSPYIQLVKRVVIPYQWDALNDLVDDAAPSYAIQNFRIAAGEEEGSFGGMVFQDSDLYKWLEAVGFMLASQPDSELEQVADDVIALIEKAQQPDGYLNTYFTLKEPGNRWTNLAECHELYCAGHLIEAGVAYYRSTGKRRLLDVCCRYADYVDTVFGREEGKLQGYDGHQEIELALVKLYEVTEEERYLKLSQYFLNERGNKPSFYLKELENRQQKVHFPELDIAHDLAYSQAHLPVREQETAVGHAVRVVYMCTGMAHVAAVTNDEILMEACRKLWSNIVHKQMYITGAIGAMAYGEAFTVDYDLPNDTVYGETCASIGLIFFARRMLEIEPKSEYADVLERALYNTVISGMAKDGKHFFYVNPLEVFPKAIQSNKIYEHVKVERQQWFGCSCCPPNIARLIASLNEYVYSVKERTLYTHLYIGGEAELKVANQSIHLEQASKYTIDGSVSFKIRTEHESVDFTFALRVPAWCEQADYKVNGFTYKPDVIENGYMKITRLWQSEDTVEVQFDMPVKAVKGHPLIRQNTGKIALQRGPFIYCMEEVDNGGNLHLYHIQSSEGFSIEYDADLLGGLHKITAAAIRTEVPVNETALYFGNTQWSHKPAQPTFIPYFAWGNRGAGEMMVWVKESLS